MKKYVLDACGLIAFLRNEIGGEHVKRLLTKADREEVTILMHNASLAEVYYDFIKAADKITADDTLLMIGKLPLVFIDAVDMDFIKEIAFFKSNFKVSFADCFVLVLAKLQDAIIITSDHHEFDIIEKRRNAKFEWIR
jgi:PIN domain nuclease of toxin-antitoxin system